MGEISNRFDNVLTKIDQGGYNGKEQDIFAWQPEQPPAYSQASMTSMGERAQYSERVYEPPSARAERDAHVDADWRMGTKAMVIKSVPMDCMNTIVFAIRGTATFMDWAVNLNTAPTSPAGFLDDPFNLCHAGFLSVARKMVTPVASRLRQLLEEDPSRASYSLLITGHSAGGAVAALLYSHMHASSNTASSELNAVAGCFKRIHCITFGTPPISLVPLTKPTDFARRPQFKKSLFMNFVNEGDPVTRADKAYVKSLLELFAAPAPPRIKPPSPTPNQPTALQRDHADPPSPHHYHHHILNHQHPVPNLENPLHPQLRRPHRSSPLRPAKGRESEG
ncbi:hypothetical protein N0V88_002178 [Collariella sp. IMI 366227]|nr:hypothetical protein N0V88_002178 [Collariella sp. IMI 366227]